MIRLLSRPRRTHILVMYALSLYAIAFGVSVYSGIDLLIDQAPDAYCSIIRYDYHMAIDQNASNETLAGYNQSLQFCGNRSHAYVDTVLPPQSK